MFFLRFGSKCPGCFLPCLSVFLVQWLHGSLWVPDGTVACRRCDARGPLPCGPWPWGWQDVWWWELQGGERPSDPKLWGLEGGPEVVAFGRASGRKVGDLVVKQKHHCGILMGWDVWAGAQSVKRRKSSSSRIVEVVFSNYSFRPLPKTVMKFPAASLVKTTTKWLDGCSQWDGPMWDTFFGRDECPFPAVLPSGELT